MQSRQCAIAQKIPYMSHCITTGLMHVEQPAANGTNEAALLRQIAQGQDCWNEQVLSLGNIDLFRASSMSRTLIGSEYADGGGIRGYSSLVILRALIEKIAEIERRYDAGEERQRDTPHSSWRDDERDPLPCHYFDYAVGTSTGG